jgi:cation diffusion facilitator family transporter
VTPRELSDWTHPHVFDETNVAAERGTRLVMLITAAMMVVVEIVAGWWFNSMALLADGWHMSSHALAIGLSAVAYASARRYAHDPRFAFGTWKIEVLAGFASAIFLLGIAAWMVAGSLERLYRPESIHFAEAIFVAVIGLGVNIVCAVILGSAHDHGHAHGHGHDGQSHGHDHHHDLNLKSAYVHVVADAATSVLAILALVGGMLFGWNWLDPVMGIVGAVLVAVWSAGLLKETGRVLLDREMDHPVVDEVRQAIAARWGDAAQIADLHVWRVGKARYACIAGIVSDDPGITPCAVKTVLAEHEELVHVTVEINRGAHRIRQASAADGLLGHHRIGNGPVPVLVMHEWLGDHANWEPLWPLLDAARFSFVFADLRGYGWSRALPGAYTADEAAADALRLMDHLGFAHFHVVGHSMSGMVAQKMLALAPARIDGLVLVSPVPPSGFAADAATLGAMLAVVDDDEAARSAIAARIGNRYGKAWIERKLRLARAAAIPAAMRGYLAMFTATDFAAAVQGNPVPVLAIVGRHDIPFYREDSVRTLLAPLFPNLSIVVCNEAGHYAMLEAPAFVAAQIEKFAGGPQ